MGQESTALPAPTASSDKSIRSKRTLPNQERSFFSAADEVGSGRALGAGTVPAQKRAALVKVGDVLFIKGVKFPYGANGHSKNRRMAVVQGGMLLPV